MEGEIGRRRLWLWPRLCVLIYVSYTLVTISNVPRRRPRGALLRKGEISCRRRKYETDGRKKGAIFEQLRGGAGLVEKRPSLVDESAIEERLVKSPRTEKGEVDNDLQSKGDYGDLQMRTLPGSATYRHPDHGEPLEIKRFSLPSGIAVSGGGELYVTNTGTHQVFKVTKEKHIVIAGTGLQGRKDGHKDDADFSFPTGVAVSPSNKAIYVSEPYNHTIRRIVVQTGIVTTLTGQQNYEGLRDGTLDYSIFSHPKAMACHRDHAQGDDELIVADTGNMIMRRISQLSRGDDAEVEAIPFGDDPNFRPYMDFNGVSTVRQLCKELNIPMPNLTFRQIRHLNENMPKRIPFRSTLYKPRRDSDTQERVYFGAPPIAFDTRRSGNPLTMISGVAVDSEKNIYFLDLERGRLRKMTPEGSTVMLKTQFNRPMGLCIDPLNNIYVADTNNHRIRKVTPNGRVATIAGQIGRSGNADGPALSSLLHFPTDVAVDKSGNIFICDKSNHAIRKLYNATKSRATRADESSNGAAKMNRTHNEDNMQKMEEFYA